MSEVGLAGCWRARRIVRKGAIGSVRKAPSIGRAAEVLASMVKRRGAVARGGRR